ncbi:hypothetical protein GCM10009827_068670 [Dactylosporangium maewongense]|uniref:OmpR/PhoB-type domain-containing protein n=1 Tax=Dactylosporangium maewongense TaxID=634393 RepID=A0ABN2BHK8_9ACTN
MDSHGGELHFRLLGPVQIEHRGRPVDLGPRRGERCLLGLLLLEATCGVLRMSRLQGLLWDDDPPERARRTVHTYVARLRSRLRPHDVQIVTHSTGYRIDVDPQRVDVHRFVAEIDRARALPDPAHRADALARALTLWRGPLLADVAGDDLRARVGLALEERRSLAIELRAQADLQCGRNDQVAAELTELTAQQPTRERLAELLMLAYYRAGRQADALEVYRRSWRYLHTELGVQPGWGLREVHTRILRSGPVQDLVDGRRATP